MAKQKTEKLRQELMLEMVEFTPTKDVNGEKVQQCYADGTPVVKKIFVTKLSILGKLYEFKVYPKEMSERDILVDFFTLKGVKHLPITVLKKTFKNDMGENINVYDVCVVFDELHTIALKPADVDKGRWNMAIREIESKYQLPEEYQKIRRENYEKAVAGRKADAKDGDLPW